MSAGASRPPAPHGTGRPGRRAGRDDGVAGEATPTGAILNARPPMDALVEAAGRTPPTHWQEHEEILQELSSPADDDGRHQDTLPGRYYKLARRMEREVQEVARLRAMQAWLSNAISSFDERSQTILYLRYFRGMTDEQVAAELGLTKDTVGSIVAQTLVKLRSQRTDQFGGVLVRCLIATDIEQMPGPTLR